MAVVVCVTGAGGFIGSWIVKLLLARGYAVRGTSRRADDPKSAHLWALDGAAEWLTMVQVDLLDRASLRAAFDGCDGVIHTASPMHENPEEIIEPVITRTRNVVEVAADVGVRRVVLSSTIGTMYMDPRRDPDVPLDESCWGDLDYCKNTKNWYCYAKTIAERGAWDVARAAGAGAGPGGGDPGGGARRDAAARHEHQHQAHSQVPHRRGQDVREQVARLRARQGRGRGARQGARGVRGQGTVRLRREDAAPWRALPDPRRALPGVPHSYKAQG